MDTIDYNAYGDNPACKNTRVTFRIVGDALDPDEVTKALGIEPSRAFSKGEEYATRKVGIRKRPIGHWSITSDGFVSSTSTEEHARFILQALEPIAESVVPYVQNRLFRTSIVFWWEAKDGHGGFTLSSDTLSRLCSFCNDIDHHFVG